MRSIYERYRDEYVGKLDVPADRRYLKVDEGRTIYVKPGEERFLTAEVIAAFSMTAPRERIISGSSSWKRRGWMKSPSAFPTTAPAKESRAGAGDCVALLMNFNQ